MVLSDRSQIRQTTERFINQPGLLRFAMIQDIVWIDFSVSDSKFHYMGEAKIKFQNLPLLYIGDTFDGRFSIFIPILNLKDPTVLTL